MYLQVSLEEARTAKSGTTLYVTFPSKATQQKS
jgi:hypothetical protein